MSRLMLIKGWPDYYISDKGEVISDKRDTMLPLKPTEHNGKQPYYYVTLSNGNKQKKFLVHRLVALHFIPNPKNLSQVNHKDGNPQNNLVGNLEWCTNAHNTQHAYDTNLNERGHYSCILHDTLTGETHDFNSMRKAELSLGLGLGGLSFKFKRNGNNFNYCQYEVEVMPSV